MQKQGSNFTILVVLCSALFAATSHAENLAVRNCTWCHGGSANGYSPAPALAGQRPAIRREAARQFPCPHAGQSLRAPVHVGRGEKSRRPSQCEIWPHILPVCRRERPVTVCPTSSRWEERSIKKECRTRTSWHASSVTGRMPKASERFLAWAGLDYSYLKRRLEQWNEGYHAAAGPPMISISSKLSNDQMEALASYLSFVR